MKNVIFRLPPKVKCLSLNNTIIIKGPIGKLKIFTPIKFIQKSQTIRFSRSLTWPEIVKFKQAIVGVSVSYVTELELKGIGFKIDKIKNQLLLKLGYSHLLSILIPGLIKVSILKNCIYLSSPSLIELKNFSSKIRSLNVPDSYKGQGILYRDEVIIKKEGKKV